MIKITIITATYNSEKTLEQTISSVVEQDYPNIEYIIVDGKSIDNTMKLVKKYESFGIKWISEEDNGLYDALNKGIDLATGDYLMILGSDDSLYSNNTISNIVNNLDEDTDVLSASVFVVDEVSCKTICNNNHNVLNKKKYAGGMIPHQGMVVRTALSRKHKFDTKYKISADYKFFLQCYYNDDINFKYIDDPVAFYSNNGVSADVDSRIKENNQIYKELRLSLLDSKIDSDKLWKKYVKIVLMKINVLLLFWRFKQWWRITFIWKKHHCNNKICRWCGRM